MSPLYVEGGLVWPGAGVRVIGEALAFYQLKIASVNPRQSVDLREHVGVLRNGG